MGEAKLGPTIDELIRELSIEEPSRPAPSAQQGTSRSATAAPVVAQPLPGLDRKVYEGVPSGITIVYKDAGSNEFVIQAGKLIRRISLGYVVASRVSLSLGPRIAIAYETERQTHGFFDKIQYEPYVVSLTIDGTVLGEIKSAKHPTFLPAHSHSIAYIQKDGIFVDNAAVVGARKMVGREEIIRGIRQRGLSVGSRDISESLALHDYRNDCALIVYDNAQVFLANTHDGYVTSLDFPFPIPGQVHFRAGMQLSPAADKVYYVMTHSYEIGQGKLGKGEILAAYWNNTQNSRTVANIVAKIYDSPGFWDLTRGAPRRLRIGNIHPFNVRLSADGRFLGYAWRTRIDVLDLQTQETWQIKGATAPFDIK